MLIWLDDQKDDPDTPDRHPPSNEWFGFKSPKKVIYLIKIGIVDEISFDHDLGNHVIGNGYTVAKFIEREAFHGRCKRIKWSIHSANPIGRENIKRAMESAERFWDSQGI